MSNISELKGSNFSYWNEHILITLECLNLELYLCMTDISSPQEKSLMRIVNFLID
jgi:hypothetical protein